MADISCEPGDLATAAKCYCYDETTWKQVMVYLLAQLADKSASTPAELAQAAKCYCFPEPVWNSVMAYLLCQAANAQT